MGQASCHGYDYCADRSVIAKFERDDASFNGKGQLHPSFSSEEVIRNFSNDPRIVDRPSYNDSRANLKNRQSKFELLVRPDASGADAGIDTNADAGADTNADAREKAMDLPTDSACNITLGTMSSGSLNTKNPHLTPTTPVACALADRDKNDELQPTSADTTVVGRSWETTPRSDISASASSSSSARSNTAECTPAQDETRLAKEVRRAQREQRQKLKWLEEQRKEEEKRREAERIKKDEQRRAAREAAILEEKRLDDEARIKRDKDAKRLEAFLLEHNYVAVNSKTKKPLRKWGKYDYPLHKAVELNDDELVRILIEFGASPEMKNSSSKKPLDKALKRKLDACEDWSKWNNIVSLLQKKDFQPYFRSNVSTACSSTDLSRRVY